MGDEPGESRQSPRCPLAAITRPCPLISSVFLEHIEVRNSKEVKTIEMDSEL